ncbi:MAG: hypothetical protein HWE16_09910 [Gammaproteobacteria bacterium]|nr:hypothetical protein [Gammaproteobacteria bacterium]
MSKSVNCAEVLDRMQKGVAWGMIVCGITYFFVAAEKVFEENPLNDYLDFASAVGVFFTFVVTFIAIFPVAKLKLQGKMKDQKEPESFVAQSLMTSIVRSFHINIIFLVLLLAFQKPLDDWGMPPSFYLILIFGSMVFWVGANFLYLTRSDDFDEDELEE